MRFPATHQERPLKLRLEYDEVWLRWLADHPATRPTAAQELRLIADDVRQAREWLERFVHGEVERPS